MFNQVRGYLTSKQKDEPNAVEIPTNELGDDAQSAVDELDDLFK
jgi:hypothetical protein